ncbi:hypothetical protein HBI56_156190 [Parastagonospora nodorum]|uniref:Uncharacterized protein n=1 Tax=Phaeosphaeria nodorum (strain SN15 / ATCC MYA-4574 / FGSC 10173) TaxID=321614 RepID=A0A7U2NP04_PHANO|nr:hypothetical protein HBH56_118880 [Parastagonospora nodorum]QRD05327.1 hypothetical protein JI435_422280 [Parastagonospora nodorum SN15]KAH3928947.1 hypothetical protein HBH54_130320 [Parastagonospora nodorum]KAH3950519.1 hypothetical protein HBH53_070610 [Parastagonospora nodorum]KAH3959758.1 hypothetical protein HBH51_197270 [Parastagonospora nodorum]
MRREDLASITPPTPTSPPHPPEQIPRLLDPILHQGIGIWSREAPRLTPFPGAKPRLFRSPPDLPNIGHGRLAIHSPSAAGKRQPLHSRDPWAFSPQASTALLV